VGAVGPHLGVLLADTVVIGWMGSSAAFQTLTLQSLCLEVFGFFSVFNPVPGWEKLLMPLTRRDDKVTYRLVLAGMRSSKACFSSFMSMHCSSLLSLGSIGVFALQTFSKLGMLWCSPRCTTPFSRVRVVFRGAPLVFGVIWFGCETGRIHAGRRACSNVLSFVTWLRERTKLQVEV